MTPHDFLRKWRSAELKERSASQSHFNDLCALLGVVDPVAADPKGEWFTFEKGAGKTSGGDGWADVWRRDCFAWEYKGRHANLDKALQQLLQYARSLENPPLLIVSDMDVIRVHTNFTNSVHEVHPFTLDDLLDGSQRERLKQVFTDPEAFRPAKTRQMLTEEVAREFATLAQRLRDRGHDRYAVAHFVIRCAFCLFAQNAALLPDRMFTRLLEESRRKPEDFEELAADLFRLMRTGGRLGLERVAWFNGGLFDNDAVLPLTRNDVDLLHEAAKRDWSQIDPAILGTLFERGLDPDKRSQLGAHYTDRAKIELIVGPVIAEPLMAEWIALRDAAAHQVEDAEAAATAVRDRAKGHGELKEEVRALESVLVRGAQPFLPLDLPRQQRVRELDTMAAEVRAAAAGVRAARDAVQTARDTFLARLRDFRVLDPACGSGNFLYVALKLLKDIEHRVNVDAEALGVQRRTPEVGPANVLGIELNPFAAELARTSVWIGDIQWMRANGFEPSRDPILKPLETIECRDAVLAEDGTRAEWPVSDAIVGNPPFLGNKKMLGELGEDYTTALRSAWSEVPGGVDLVCYWFAKAWATIVSGRAKRAGLVATNSIRSGANREVLKSIVEHGRIFQTWSDEEWSVEGAAVRVSLVCFDDGGAGPVFFDGRTVGAIFADLSAERGGTDLTSAVRLASNKGVAFQGPVKVGAFDVGGEVAREWLQLPVNPNGRSNSEVVRPLLNGMDIMRRPSDRWIVHFGEMPLSEAAFYEKPFEYVRTTIKPLRDRNRDESRRENWWRLGRSGRELVEASKGLNRAIFTPRVAKHRVFVWAPSATVPDSRVAIVARDDDTTFGVLHSRFHELWSLALGGWHGVGNDPQYTPSLGFESFPFPEDLTPNLPAADYAGDACAKAIAAAAARLNELREAWLNPPEWVVREPEVVAGYPDRILPKDEDAAKELKKRTLTNLYNERPTWLANAHTALDEAVAEAYGWGDDWRAGLLTDDEILARLFRLNQERADQTA